MMDVRSRNTCIIFHKFLGDSKSRQKHWCWELVDNEIFPCRPRDGGPPKRITIGPGSSSERGKVVRTIPIDKDKIPTQWMAALKKKLKKMDMPIEVKLI